MARERPLADAVFRPKRIALIGVSVDTGRAAGRILPYLKRHGFKGEIVPVNPRRRRIGGLKCYADIADAPGPVDHAYILLAGEAAAKAAADCAAAGVRCASILTGGFADAGAAGAKAQARLVETAREAGMRLIGPNSIGTIDTHSRLALSVNAVLAMPKLERGTIGVLSHSGSLIGSILARGQARGLNFSRLVSVGNEADLGMGELGEMLVADADTDAILLFVETLRGREGFAAMARAAHAAGKPLIAYRLGRSEEGGALAASHTGALTGGGAGIDAFLDDLGIARVENWDALVECAPLFAGGRPPPKPGGRIAVMATTGGGGAMVVDRLGEMGVATARPGAEARKALAKHGLAAGAGGLIDLTIAGTRPEVVTDVMRAIQAQRDVAAVVMAVGSSAQFHPEQAVAPLLGWRDAAKPICAYLVPEAAESQRLLAKGGIAAFRTPEACADAVRALLRRRSPAKPRRATLGPRVRAVTQALTHVDPDEQGAQALFGTLGIARPRLVVINGPEGATEAAKAVGFPCAVKVLSPDIAHKTEAGGVVLGIGDQAGLTRVCRAILAAAKKAAPGAAIRGLLVQRMAGGGLAEALIGFRRDPVAGPIVTLAAGGVTAELYRDIAVRVAPVGEAEARTMIDEIKALRPLTGWRGLPKGDLAALADAVAALSRLAAAPEIAEAEINPLIVMPEGQGVAAVDGLVRMAE
jgi:acyl-CoA synthetase (NDP forming)